MEIPFIGGAYTARSSNLNAQTCINFFPVVDQQDAKAAVALFGTPGLLLFATVVEGDGNPVRALYTVGNYLYAVVKDKVYSISLLGVVTLLGTISTETGRVVMADNSIEIIIVDGTTSGFLITLSDNSFAAIADEDFPASSSVTFQDGFFIVTETGTRKFFISGLYDGTAWDATEFATVEGRPSNVLTVMSNVQDLWFFSGAAVEVYYNSGEAFPFTRIAGALIDVGCGAAASPCKINGRMYWLTNTGKVCRNTGYSSVEYVSTQDIEYIFSTYAPINDAIGYTVTVDGHDWYVLTFPTLGKTWVYDTSTTFWFEWQSYLTDVVPWGRHRSNCAVQFGRNVVVGDYTNGLLYTLSMSTYTDNQRTIRRQRATQTINKERFNVAHNSIELEFEAGVGLTGVGQGINPQVILDWSNDGGHTWSNQHWVTIGAIGEYKWRAVWRRLGISRNRVYRITVSDPVKTVIIGAYANLEVLE